LANGSGSAGDLSCRSDRGVDTDPPSIEITPTCGGTTACEPACCFGKSNSRKYATAASRSATRSLPIWETIRRIRFAEIDTPTNSRIASSAME